MDYSVNILFDRRGVASDIKNGCVEVEIYQDGKRKRYSTGVNIKKHEWKNGMVVNRLDAAVLNAKIAKKYQEMMSLASRDGFSINNVNVVELGKMSLCDWIEERINKRTDIGEQTRKLHLGMLRSLRKCGLFNTFSDLTPKNLKLWDDEIRTHVTMQTSVYNYHKHLKPYIKVAMQLDYITSNPYDKFKVAKGKSDSRKFLTEEERTRVEELELGGTIAVVRDMFIFSCYTGLADVDLRKVSRDDIVTENGQAYIVDKRLKTGTGYKLLILPKAKEILERYDYNLDKVSNQKCNMLLKGIQVAAKIKTKLTMHVGRHTFATWALKRGVPIEIVSKMLAHADIQTTQIYAKILQEDVTKGFELLK